MIGQRWEETWSANTWLNSPNCLCFATRFLFHWFIFIITQDSRDLGWRIAWDRLSSRFTLDRCKSLWNETFSGFYCDRCCCGVQWSDTSDGLAEKSAWADGVPVTFDNRFCITKTNSSSHDNRNKIFQANCSSTLIACFHRSRVASWTSSGVRQIRWSSS